MGTIYEAFDDARGVPVAVKTWRPVTEGDQRRAVRLSREAQALSELRHPAVVAYVDHGVSPEHGAFLVIDWVAGETLASRFASGGVSPADAVRLVRRLAEGLAALHERGIVHRDLKPANVMLPGPDPAGAIIVDLGIARLGSESDLTRTGTNLGTPRYMAPEQIRSARTVDGRADVFALGCVFVEAVTGRPAFEGADPVSVLARILFEPPPMPTARRRELPAAFDDVARALLAREPGRRPTAAGVLRLLDDVASRLDDAALATLPAMSGGASERDPTSPGSTQAGDDPLDAGAPPSFRVADGSARATALRVLPRDRGPFFGRDGESARIASLLASGARVVTVWGGPGVGKTRLVDEVVRSLLDGSSRPGWDVLVHGDLSDAADADDMVRILAREAGVSLEPGLAPEVALGRALSRLGRVLVMADPVDHVASAFAASVRAWKTAAPEVQIVAVSRARLQAPDAVALELGPLSTDTAPGEWSPAAALFVARASEALSGVPHTFGDGEQRELVERVVRLLAGVPLAIELYAARVPVLGLSGLVAQTVPGGSLPTLDVNQGTMRSAVLWSWNRLGPPEQRALAQCAAFRGGFDVAAASAVVRLDGEGPSVLELVESLRNKSLLVSRVSGSDARLSMLPAVRELASERLEASPERDAVVARHAAHYARLFRATPSHGTPQASRLEEEADNLLGAAEIAVSDAPVKPVHGLECLIALEPAMVARGAVGSFRALLDRAVDGATEDEPPALGQLRARARQLRARLEAPRDPRQARADLELCLAEARLARDVHFEATVLVDLGVAYHLERTLPDAERCYVGAVQLLVPLDDLRSEGRAIGNLGALAHDGGELGAAATAYRQAIALLEEAGEAPWRANFTGLLALIEQELGNLDEARRLYESAVALLEPVRNARLLAIALGNYGVLRLELGEPSAALPLFERSRSLLSGSSDRRSEAICQSRIGAALALLDRVDEASVRVMRAERLAQKLAEPLAVEAAALVHALVKVALGRRAHAARDTRALHAAMDEARAAILRAKNAVLDGRPVSLQSDDVRATLRITERDLGRLEASLSVA
jgi:predicted ATPase